MGYFHSILNSWHLEKYFLTLFFSSVFNFTLLCPWCIYIAWSKCFNQTPWGNTFNMKQHIFYVFYVINLFVKQSFSFRWQLHIFKFWMIKQNRISVFRVFLSTQFFLLIPWSFKVCTKAHSLPHFPYPASTLVTFPKKEN